MRRTFATTCFPWHGTMIPSNGVKVRRTVLHPCVHKMTRPARSRLLVRDHYIYKTVSLLLRPIDNPAITHLPSIYFENPHPPRCHRN